MKIANAGEILRVNINVRSSDWRQCGYLGTRPVVKTPEEKQSCLACNGLEAAAALVVSLKLNKRKDEHIDVNSSAARKYSPPTNYRNDISSESFCSLILYTETLLKVT